MLDLMPFKINIFSRHFTRNCLRFDGFQLISIKKQYISQNIQVGACHLGIFTDIFSSICGTFFWEYQIDSLIWVTGHLANIHNIDNMPRDYMNLNISLAEVRAEAVWLRTQMQQKGCTCKSSTFQEISDRLCKLLAYIAYKERQQKQLEKQARQPPS